MTTSAEIAAALDENRSTPAGPVRSAKSERLVELAAQTGDRPLLITALQELIRAYEYGGEGDKIMVPFARTIQLWDDNPADFDHSTRYTLHWHFKWVTSGMLAHPNVALASINRWLDEMAVRYRQAGYGLHAVHANRHYVAEHVGDHEAAQRAFDDWLAADRDQMSDCHACDASHQGDWYRTTGRDSDALAAWEPVLAGRLCCEEEPHRVLSKSLLPLVRLGRHGDARANHLRGYRMVRGNPNLRAAVGRHIEFAALTGNEARALEILAGHAGWLTDEGESVHARLLFLEGVAVLLRRLDALGHGDLPLAASRTVAVRDLRPEVEREIAEIGARYDERNGTSAVSDRSRERLSREPFPVTLVLGIRAAPVADPKPAPAPAGIEELVAEAIALSDQRHPRAHDLWDQVAASGADLDAATRLRVAESRAIRLKLPEPARAAFQSVATGYADLGDQPRALLNRARAALAATMSGDGATGRDELAGVLAELPGPDDRILLMHARERLHRWYAGGDHDPAAPGYAELTADLQRMIDEAGDPYHRANPAEMLAQARLAIGAHEEAEKLLSMAADEFVAAGTPWHAVGPLETLAEMALAHDDPAGAEQRLAAALRHGGSLLPPAETGRLHRQLAQALWPQDGRGEEVVDHALAAAQHLDRHDPAEAAGARMIAAYAFDRLGRPAEAVGLIEAALPDLERHGDEADVVSARRCYGLCLQDLGEPRAAAEALLGAAAIAQKWPDQSAHASLAHDAGAALQAAGMPTEAAQAFARAAELWPTVGQPAMQVRARRARAWVLARLPEPDWSGAEAEMAAAMEVAAKLAAERAETHLQTAHLLLDRLDAEEPADDRAAVAQRGLTSAHAAASGFTASHEYDRAAQAHFAAAVFETEHLDRAGAAAERIRTVRDEAAGRGDTGLAERCDRYLEHIG